MPTEGFCGKGGVSARSTSNYAMDELLKELFRPTGSDPTLESLGSQSEEVARATGTSVGAVKQKAHRAYEKLRVAFGGNT